jgi:hypothetical protein
MKYPVRKTLSLAWCTARFRVRKETGSLSSSCVLDSVGLRTVENVVTPPPHKPLSRVAYGPFACSWSLMWMRLNKWYICHLSLYWP